MRTLLVLFAIALALAACSGDDDTAATTTSGAGTATTTTTTFAPATSTTAAAATTTTTAAAAESTTTTTTTSTTTTVAPGPGLLAMTRVVFEPIVYVTITNVGNGPMALGDHWLCQRPAYTPLPSLTLEPGDTIAIGVGDAPPPDLVEYAAVVQLDAPFGAIRKEDGELGLYTRPAFDDATAILDYVEWGSSGHGRSDVAVAAGIWAKGAFIDIPSEATSISSSGRSGGGPEDWSVDLGG